MTMTTNRILGNTRRPDISFFSSGKIDITSRIVNALGIESGDVIDIMTQNGEFYLHISIRAADTCGRHEARCYPSHKGSRHFRAYSRRLSEAIMRDCGIRSDQLKQVSFNAGEIVEINGVKTIPIITRNKIIGSRSRNPLHD